MSQRRYTYPHSPLVGPAALGSAVTRAGLAIVVASLPLAVGSAAGLLADAPSIAIGIQTMLAVTERSPSLGTDLLSLVQLSVLSLLVGVWTLGLGLVIDGLSD